MAPSWAPRAAILGPKRHPGIRYREPFFEIFAKSAPEVGIPHGPVGKKLDFGVISEQILIDFTTHVDEF